MDGNIGMKERGQMCRGGANIYKTRGLMPSRSVVLMQWKDVVGQGMGLWIGTSEQRGGEAGVC